jgi:lipoprotein NlpD
MMRVQPFLTACGLLVLAALHGCAVRTSPAPVVDRAPPSAGLTKPGPVKPAPPQITPASGDYYVVRKGDTLYSIALEHGADYREVAQWNNLDDPTKIQVGQQLRVKAPPGVQVGAVPGTGRLEARPLESRPLEPRPAEPKPAENASASRPVVPERPPVREDPKAQPDGELQFVWPARGKVLAGFAEPRSKGIDIDGKLGDPIVAAAPGRVTYIGTGIPGLGKLVVIKHDNGFITVYAHNREILVKEQQAVTRGQKIAELGSSDADRPKLHFQIRKGSAAVDPLRYLPGS